jgi:hypothetical protein
MTTHLPDLTEESAAPGTGLNGYDRTITRADIETFLARTGETLEAYQMGDALIVPPGMLMGLYGPLIHGTFHYEAGVHVSSEMTLNRAPEAHQPLRVEGRVLDLFEKNGNKYVTFSVEVSAADGGERLATVHHTSIYALRRKGA